MELRDSVILVTGAARRVGKAIALHLGRHGAHIIVHYHRSRAEALQTVQELEELGIEAIALQADQSKPAAIRRLVAQAQKRFGHIDVLVNSAAIFERTPLNAIREINWDRHLAVNVKGPFFFAQAVAEGMRRRRRGKIINICDVAALKPWPGYIPYCASKAALLNMTMALAKALAPNVHVNAICPGTVLPPEAMPPLELRKVRNKVLMQRFGTPEDIAHAVRFCIENDYVTGTSITVDGGRLCY